MVGHINSLAGDIQSLPPSPLFPYLGRGREAKIMLLLRCTKMEGLTLLAYGATGKKKHAVKNKVRQTL